MEDPSSTLERARVTALGAASSSDTASSPTGLEPELGGIWRGASDRTGFEPELGGFNRQKAVYVDEVTCIGCKHCAHVARHTFYIEPDYGRSRVVRQDGDSEEVIQIAIETCPVDCIHWVNYDSLKVLEEERKNLPIPDAGLPIDYAAIAANRRKHLRKHKSSH